MRYLAQRSGSVVAILLTCASIEGATLSRQQAEAFERKVEQISSARRPGSPPLRTSVTEDELNSWFLYRGRPVLPEGLTNPQVTILGVGRVTGQATLDLEAIGRRRAEGGGLDLWTLLGGRLPMTVTGTLQTKDGVGRFSLESATLGGVPVPKPVLQELLGLYSRSPERPRGVSVDDPFPLPSAIRQIEVGRGEAVVVQ
jgi:hypothetical protein